MMDKKLYRRALLVGYGGALSFLVTLMLLAGGL